LGVAGKTFAAIGSGGKITGPTVFTVAVHHFAVFQVVDEVVDTCCFREANSAEFAKADIFFFFGFAHRFLQLTDFLE
jgi:hypothetical protein